MTETKRHPAAISGSQPSAPVNAASTITLNEAATHDKHNAVSSPHPAPGCSMKHVGTVRRASARNNGK